MKAWPVASFETTNLLRLSLLFVATPTCFLYPQSADQLLRETAKNYQTLTGYELGGHANVLIPDSPWKMNADITVIGPRKEPSPNGGPSRSMAGGVRFGNFKPVKAVADSPQPVPDVSFPFQLFGQFDKMADAVIDVERAGSETLQLNGEGVACDILKVAYEPSTYEHPHPESITYWISPARHLVLKEVLTYNAGRHIDHALWTITYDSAKFDRPVPQWFLDMAKFPEVTERHEWVGRTAPEFALPSSDGSPVTLSSLRGNVVMLDFWSITCGPCKLEMPMIEEVGHEYESRGVVLLGISFDPTEESKAWLDQNRRMLRTLTDSDFVASDAYKVQGVPALVLIGPDGKVKQYWEGTVSKSTLQSALGSMLKR